MEKVSKAWLWSLGLLIALLAFAALPKAAAAQATSPTDVARAVIAAISNHDLASVSNRFAPGARIVTTAGPFRNTDQSFAEWSAELDKNPATVTITTLTQTAPDTVTAEVTITGPKVPVFAHPVADTMTFTVVNGQVTHFLDAATPQTIADIGALVGAQGGSPPGMPATGVNQASFLIVLLALGLLAIGAGVLMHSLRLRAGQPR